MSEPQPRPSPDQPPSARPIAANADGPEALPQARVVHANNTSNDESRAYLLALGFLALGPLVIPRIRRSTAFSPKEQSLWSLALLAYSTLMVLILIVVSWLVISWQVSRLSTSLTPVPQASVESHHGG